MFDSISYMKNSDMTLAPQSMTMKMPRTMLPMPTESPSPDNKFFGAGRAALLSRLTMSGDDRVVNRDQITLTDRYQGF